jgi:UDP-N-acetylglucosamine--dolichyl-phosphate N-acetylglucosaminephosphotransferase
MADDYDVFDLGGGVRGGDSDLLEGRGKISSQSVGIDLGESAAVAVAILASYSLARFQSRSFPKMGISGIDIHKPERPVRAEMGGLAVLVSLALASVFYLGIDFTLDDPPVVFAAAASTVVLTGLVGLADDMIELSQKYKPLLIVAASAPLMYVLGGRISITIPMLGNVHLGLLYPLVAVPLAVTTSANFSNLLAGFNGLEAGSAVISLGTMTLISELVGNSTVAAFGMILTAAYLGFLILNWYPAKIFPGDSGTLMAGAGLAVMGLAAGLEFEAIILSIPAAMDFALKMIHRRPFKQRHLFGNTRVLPDGTLDPAPYPAVVHAFMKVSPLTERGLVLSVLAMEALFALIAITVTLIFL